MRVDLRSHFIRNGIPTCRTSICTLGVCGRRAVWRLRRHLRSALALPRWWQIPLVACSAYCSFYRAYVRYSVRTGLWMLPNPLHQSSMRLNSTWQYGRSGWRSRANHPQQATWPCLRSTNTLQSHRDHSGTASRLSHPYRHRADNDADRRRVAHRSQDSALRNRQLYWYVSDYYQIRGAAQKGISHFYSLTYLVLEIPAYKTAVALATAFSRSF